MNSAIASRNCCGACNQAGRSADGRARARRDDRRAAGARHAPRRALAERHIATAGKRVQGRNCSRISHATEADVDRAGAIRTNDVTRAHRVAARLKCGIVWVNDHHRLDPASP
jgi:hypothetical protein